MNALKNVLLMTSLSICREAEAEAEQQQVEVAAMINYSQLPSFGQN